MANNAKSKTITVHGTAQARILAALLVSETFTCEPWPDGEWRFTVRSESGADTLVEAARRLAADADKIAAWSDGGLGGPNDPRNKPFPMDEACDLADALAREG